MLNKSQRNVLCVFVCVEKDHFACVRSLYSMCFSSWVFGNYLLYFDAISSHEFWTRVPWLKLSWNVISSFAMCYTGFIYSLYNKNSDLCWMQLSGFWQFVREIAGYPSFVTRRLRGCSTCGDCRIAKVLSRSWSHLQPLIWNKVRLWPAISLFYERCVHVVDLIRKMHIRCREVVWLIPWCICCNRSCSCRICIVHVAKDLKDQFWSNVIVHGLIPSRRGDIGFCWNVEVAPASGDLTNLPRWF
jgi:hypothetical protein